MKQLSIALSALTLISAAIAPLSSSQAQEKVTVYTYDSFVSDWGPGPKIKKNFEKTCGCQLDFVALNDAAGLLSRIQLEGKNSQADIVLGLDTHLMDQAEKSDLFVPHGQALDQLKLPIAWDNKTFLPFDYGYFAFIYDSEKLKSPPTSLKDLVSSAKTSLIIQDPRSSTPGLGLMHWVRSVYGDQAKQAWADLAPKIVTVTKGWSEAYGLFLKGQSDMVLSYTTSPAYHETAEEVTKYKAARFAEGHVMQVEVAAQLKQAPNPELAQKFMAFILSDAFQDVIPTTNWMYPVTGREDQLPASFGNLITPEKTILVSPTQAHENQKSWIQEWRQGLSQ